MIANEDITALPPFEKAYAPGHSRSSSQGFCPIVFNTQPTHHLGDATLEEEEKPKHSRFILLLCVAIATLIILAVILGAVLGTFMNTNRSSDDPSPVITEPTANPTPTNRDQTSPTPMPRFTPLLSSLSVTGWSIGGPLGYFTIWLFYQDSDGQLSRSTFNSSTGNWTRIVKFATAKQNTPLAATAFNTEYYAEDKVRGIGAFPNFTHFANPNQVLQFSRGALPDRSNLP